MVGSDSFSIGVGAGRKLVEDDVCGYSIYMCKVLEAWYGQDVIKNTNLQNSISHTATKTSLLGVQREVLEYNKKLE